MFCLVMAKLASVTLPFAMKYIVDSLDTTQTTIITLPLLFLVFYGILRFGTIIFGEIRDSIFGRVTENAMRKIALNVFNHLHTLDLEFHLSRKIQVMVGYAETNSFRHILYLQNDRFHTYILANPILDE